MCAFAAHPDSAEAAVGAGGGAGGVSFGSQTVHGVCLRPDGMPSVSLVSLYQGFMAHIYVFTFWQGAMKERKHQKTVHTGQEM